MRPFGCPVTIFNTIDHLGKFDGKADEGIFDGYFLNSKTFRVFNRKTRIVEENLHIRFSKNTSNVVASGPNWLFDIDALTRIMNYEPIIAGTQSNDYEGTKASDNAGQARMETEPVKDYILLPLWTADPPFSQDLKSSHDDGSKPSSDDGKKVNEDPRKEVECKDQEKEDNVNSTNNVNTVSSPVNAAGINKDNELSFDLNMSALEDTYERICAAYLFDKQHRIENLVDHKVKVIRCDNGTEFKNKEMNQFCEMNSILRQFSVAITPQQNGVTKRRNRILIEAASTMLADHLGKFDGKADEDFFIEYSLNSKAFRVFNSKIRIVEENLHIRFSESTHNVVGSGPDWLFDIDSLTRTMNYELIVAGTQSNGFVVMMEKRLIKIQEKKSKCKDQEKEDNVNSTNNVNTISSAVNVAGLNEVNDVGGKTSIELPFDPNMPALEDISIFNFSNDDENNGAMADMNNLDTTIQVSPILTIIIHKDHPLDQVIRDLLSATQTRKMSKNLEEHGFVFRNKKDEMGIVIRNKSRLVSQGYIQEEGINYDEVFAPVARIEVIRLFLAYASFKDLMDVKSAFLYEKIEEEVYVCQPSGFEDPDFPDRVNKVQKALGKIDKTLFIKRHKEVKNTSTPMKTQKSLLKDEDGEEVDVHMYKSMIGSLIYLTSLRPDIMFAVCTCARYQVNLEVSHLHAVKRIFRYLKGQQKIGLWYTKDSPFDLIAYTDSDYAEASLDKKSTTGGCQFLGCRLISWQRKKQTVVANSITEAEYVAASSCCGQVLWIQNQLLDYGDLQFADEEGVDCLTNSTFFEQLASIGNLDNLSGKFLTYLRFIQVFLDKQIDGISNPERKYISPSHTKNFFGNMKRIGKGFSGRTTPLFLTMVAQSQLGEGSAMPIDPHYTPIILQSLSSQPQKTHKPRKPNRKDTQLPRLSVPTESVADEAVYKELDDILVRAATTASSLEAEHNSDNINKTQSKATPNNLAFKELVQVVVPGDKQSLGEDASKQERRIDDIDADKAFSLVSVHNDADKDMFDADTDLGGEEVFVEQEVVTDKEKIDEVTLAQALAELKTSKPKRAEEEMIQKRAKKQKVDDEKETSELKELMEIIPDKEEVAIDAISLAVKSPRIVDWKIYKKGKKSYYQIIRADRKSKIAKTVSESYYCQYKEITAAQVEERRIDDIVADKAFILVSVYDDADKDMFDANTDLGGEEVFVKQEVVVDKEKINEVTLAQALAELKTLKPKVKTVVIQEPKAALKLQAKFNEEQRLAREKAQKELEANIALIETWDDVQAKIDADHQLDERLQAEEQQELTDEEKATLFMQFLEKRRNSELVQGNEKRAKEEMIQKREKNQKLDDDKEKTELKELMEIIPDKEEVAIDAIPLAIKEDLGDLYKLIKAKYGSTRPVEDLNLLLWGDLKTMFEPHVEDAVFMLVEKTYPLTPFTLRIMLEKKLQVGVSAAGVVNEKYAK
uniref:Retrotransposon protein, putative, unclassified n=1 Tax=Tanacetum cinerariifolium TaxID=118510 RepID=A0A6L2P0Z3_TANCI|nr:retrotransposon protein, putative, unclassified [Tanacetum cinerariifolium]